MKKIFEMVIVVFLAVFIISVFVFANTDSAQSAPKNKPDTVSYGSVEVQQQLIDSIGKLQKIKIRLAFEIDSMDAKIKKNRALVLAGWKNMEKPKIIVIRDTVFIPVPVTDTSFKNMDYLLYNQN